MFKHKEMVILKIYKYNIYKIYLNYFFMLIIVLITQIKFNLLTLIIEEGYIYIRFNVFHQTAKSRILLSLFCILVY